MEKHLDLLKKIAVEAGEKIMEVYQSDDFNIRLKSDRSPVTQADLEANKIIVAGLKSTPYPILSEEGKDIPYKERKNWEYFWIVDPLDGTKEFIKQNGEFTVNIGLIHQGKPILGVVYVPAQKRLYFGGADIGAFVKEGDKPSKALHFESPSSAPYRIATTRSHLNQSTLDYIEKLGETKRIPLGSSLKFLKLAENEIDLYPRFGPCMEWDTAAAHAILRGMEVEVISLESRQPLTYNKENLLNPNFIVTKPGLEHLIEKA